MTSDFLYLKEWLLENGELDMYNLADDLDRPIEINLFDEKGWRIIDCLWYDEEEDQLKGWTSNDDGKEWEEDIVLSENDLSNIVKILKNGDEIV